MSATVEIVDLPVTAVTAGDNDRRHFDSEQLDLLAKSIEANGLAQPIVVRPIAGGYRIVAGERRYRAVTSLLGWDTVPAIVRDYDDATEAAVMLAENTARVNLGPLEEARAYRKRLDAGASVADIASTAGVSRSRVERFAAVTTLIDEAQHLVAIGALSVQSAQWLVGLDLNRQRLALRSFTAAELTPAQFAVVCQRLRNEQDSEPLFELTVEEFDIQAAERAAEAKAAARYGALGDARVMIERLMDGHPDAELVAEARALLERLNGRPSK